MTDPTRRETGGGAVETDDKKGTVVAYLAKATEDQYGETFKPEGWDLGIFKASGTVSFNHGSTPMGPFITPDANVYQRLPIARALRVWTESEGLLLHYQYPIEEAEGQYGEFVRTIYFLEKEGLLRGHSMWFDPYAWQEPDGNKGERGWGDAMPRIPVKGRVYTRQALLEGGPVMAPVQPDAVTLVARAFQSRGLPVPAPFREPEEKEMKTVEMAPDEFVAWQEFKARIVPPADEEKERKERAALLKEFHRVTGRKLESLTTLEGRNLGRENIEG